jgi:beta-N-acetylhexosaminidase
MKGTAVFRCLILIIILMVQFAAPVSGMASSPMQVSTPEARAQTLLEQLTPEERVGQLFLVDFDGAEIAADSPIFQLITNHHIGGVVLKAENDNFIGPENTLPAAWGLIQSLQNAESIASQNSLEEPVSGEQYFPTYVPLFISISQNGDGYPDDQILSGLTPTPSLMAIGATWDTNLAHQAGEVMGRELSALGFNLMLGPALDVLDPPRPDLEGDLSIHSFGGDPFWVGAMGGSFISGVHTGSQNRMAVVGKHFPGYPGSVRPPEEEIPTVLKTLDQLINVELSPFFVTTDLAASSETIVDGLLMSHSRYEAFQGDISTTTRPISSDPQAFEQVMSLPEFDAWRSEGGLVISDELGTRAIRRFYDPTENEFNARVVALNSFLAGNDLLVLGDFLGSNAPDEFTTITRTLSFFAQKYREDLAFAQRVDDAVLRILTLKFKLYEDFTIDDVLADEGLLETVGESTEITFDIARQAVTLFSPAPEDLDAVLPSPPTQIERVVIFTDSFLERQCSTCPYTEALPSNALKLVVSRLYGPDAGGIILSRNLFSYSFTELDAALDPKDEEDENPVLTTLEFADWIIFVMLDIDQTRPTSNALRRFLSERPDLIQDKKTVVFAHSAPYYLDATDISKLTAYYGLYSKHPQFIEVAARLLFKELTTPGASPVSIDGIGYILSEATSPDQDQTFGLIVYPADTGPPPDTDEETPEPPVDYGVGDTVVIETEVILDHNGHQVPDNTPVTILLDTTTADGSSSPREISSITLAGIARTSFILENAGVLEIQVTSGDPAALSEVVQIDVADTGETGPVVVVTGTPAPTDPAQATPIVTPEGPSEPTDKITLGNWLLALMVIIFISLFAYQIGATAGHVRWGVRWGLAAMIGGLSVNTYLSFDLPGASALILDYQLWGIVISAAVGSLLGWLFGLVWRYIKKQ